MRPRRPEETRSVYSPHDPILAAIGEDAAALPAKVKPEPSVQRSSVRHTARGTESLAKMVEIPLHWGGGGDFYGEPRPRRGAYEPGLGSVPRQFHTAPFPRSDDRRQIQRFHKKERHSLVRPLGEDRKAPAPHTIHSGGSRHGRRLGYCHRRKFSGWRRRCAKSPPSGETEGAPLRQKGKRVAQQFGQQCKGCAANPLRKGCRAAGGRSLKSACELPTWFQAAFYERLRA